MNITFIGGGSLRVLPVVRALLNKGHILTGGSIRLVDLKLERAEAVGRMIKRCPEFVDRNCSVMWTDSAEKGLDGTDVLYVTMAIQRQPSLIQARRLGKESGIWTSDMLSPNGAFLAMRGGAPILNFARIMEKCAPDALMLIFANPVAVFSAMVNNFTKIRALGICQGFHNHRWDIPRLIGKSQHDNSIQVVSAGINHFSFIQYGTWGTRDIFEVLDENLPPDFPAFIEQQVKNFNIGYDSSVLQAGLNIMVDTYKRNRCLLFSSEGDGMYNLNPELSLKMFQDEWFPGMSVAEATEKTFSGENARFEKFASTAKNPDDSVWTSSDPFLAPDEHNLANDILGAMAGGKHFRIAASAPNRGAVKGFTDDMPLEYTMEISDSGIHAVEDQTVPDCYHGLISAYSKHQNLLAKALGTGEPEYFRDALDSYPALIFNRDRNEYFTKMFDIYNDLPDKILELKRYYR